MPPVEAEKDNIRLTHMLNHAVEAMQLLENRTFEDLTEDRLLNLSSVRLLEIIGEAANRVTPATRLKLSGVQWPEIIALRNRLIHGYDSIDFKIMWPGTLKYPLGGYIAI